jgi:hypothetical protein
LFFENGGTIPSSDQHKFKSLYAEDYIYMVYKYMQENDKIDGDVMQRIRTFAHTKFRGIFKDLDMSLVLVEKPVKLAHFYSDYAAKIESKDFGGWSW